MNNFLKEFQNNKWYILLLSLVVIAGIIVRMKGLGKWPLAIDEYYIVKSVENILYSGIPEWPNGGFYLRGLLYQYIVAVLLLFGIKVEFAVRIIPVLSNILIIPPLYVLTKKISGTLQATIIVIIFCFSLWEIEFARFGRMYAPFQMIFVWYIYFLYKYIIESDVSAIKWLFILSFSSLFVYEGSIFIVLLNFILLFWDSEKKMFRLDFLKGKVKYLWLITSLIILAGAYIINIGGSRDLNSADLFPDNYKVTHSHLFENHFLNKPVFLITTLIDNLLWIIPFTFIVGFNFYSLRKIWILYKKNFIYTILFTSLILFSLLNLFGLVIIFGTIFFILNWLTVSHVHKKEFLILINVILINLIFWFLFAIFTNSWHSVFGNFADYKIIAIIKKIALIFFNFPDFYYDLWIYLITVPIQTFIFIVSFPVLVISIIKKEYLSTLNTRFILFVFILLIVFVSLIDTSLMETRYTFFLYPLTLVIYLLFFKTLSENVFKGITARNIALIIIAIIYLVFSEDFSINHIKNIDSKEFNFRTVYNENIKRHYYPRWDVKTPAEIVNKQAHHDDIIIIDELNIEYYLDRLDYVYLNYNNPNFTILSVNSGANERWTNSKLIYRNIHLLDKIKESQNNIWFITIHKPELERINFKENFSKFLYYKSIDNAIFVYKIPGGTEISLNHF